jgi:hypothetical protein
LELAGRGTEHQQSTGTKGKDAPMANEPVFDDDRFFAPARGGEWLPSDHPAASSAADAAEWLGY